MKTLQLRTIAILCFALAAPLRAQDSLPSFQLRGIHLGDSIETVPDKGYCIDMKERGPGQRYCSKGQSIGGADVQLGYLFLDARLVSVNFGFESQAFDRLAEVLTAGYGVPKAREEPFRTRGGVEGVNRILAWPFREGQLELERFGESLLKGRATIFDRAALAELDRRSKESAKDAAARDLLGPRKP